MRAARESLKDMDIAIVTDKVSDLDGTIKARTATDKSVSVTAKMEGQDVTAISIRFGFFGDQNQSVALHNRIKEKLDQ